MMEELTKFMEGTTIIKGDFNITFEPALDTTANRSRFSYPTQNIKTNNPRILITGSRYMENNTPNRKRQYLFFQST